MTVTDRSAVPRPPCPQCAAPLDIDWIEVTTFGAARPTYTHGLLHCPTNPDHDTRRAARELSWPTELTEEDRAWMRAHSPL